MLSGIVQQEVFKDVRKLPFFGDIPLFGGLFRSTEQAVRNRELIVFLTPRVVEYDQTDTDQTMERYRQRLDEIKGQMENIANPKSKTNQPQSDQDAPDPETSP